MRLVPNRPLVAGLFFIAAVTAFAASVAPSSTGAQGRGVVAVQMRTPDEVKAVIDAKRGELTAPLASPDQNEVLVAEEGFESDTFPPAGWSQGTTDTPDYQWSRETCQVGSGTASAWAVGGGAAGDQLPCGSNYTAPFVSVLLYGPFDGSTFTRGVRLEWLSKHKFPGDRGDTIVYAFCVQYNADQSICIRPRANEVPDWVSFVSNPIPEAARASELYAYFIYRDPTPTGEDYSAFVDNARIFGLTGEAPPTWTPESVPQPVRGVYLPLNEKHAQKSDFPDIEPVLPGSGVAFGTDLEGTLVGDVVLDARLINSGTVFQYGQMAVCTRVTWWGQGIGTTLHWQWSKDGAPILPENVQINPTLQLPTENGSAGNCLASQDQDGNPVPIPLGTFSVAAMLNGVESSTGSVVFQNDPPPGATALPTPHPTIAPTEEPRETPVGPCREFIRNGDFSLGPTVWGYGQDPQTNRTLSDVILDGISNTSPTWAARLGGVLVQGGTHIEEIRQPSSPVGLIDPARMISATLSFNAGLLTNEVPGAPETDVMVIAFADRNQGVDPHLLGYLSEDTMQVLGQYLHYDIDVTGEMSDGTGIPESLIIFQQQQNDQLGSNWYLDDVSLEVCRTEGAAGTPLGAPAQARSSRLTGDPVVQSAAGGSRGSLDRLDVRGAKLLTGRPVVTAAQESATFVSATGR